MSAAQSGGRIAGHQRYRPDSPCPVCNGCERDARGQGRRCTGFLSEDGEWARCSREEHAGSIPVDPKTGCYPHRLKGPCKCGTEHGPADYRPDRPRGPAPKRRIVAEYDYRDEAGNLLYQVLRYNDKTFSQRRPSGVGKTYIYKLGDVRRVPYRLPELVASDPGSTVYVVEGEKDADNLRALGLVATCNPMGAGKWLPEYSPFLAGRPVCIVPDNDEDGRGHAESVARSLAGIAREVRRIDLAEACRSLGLGTLPEKGDASDFLKMGGTAGDLVRIFDEAAPFVPESATEAVQADDGPEVVDRWPVIDEAAYHGIAGEIVRESMPHTEADPVAVLIQFLVGFANVVGRGPHWTAGATHHHLVMFAALVGPTSSGRKGSSWDIARYFLRNLDSKWADGCVKSGVTSGEGLIYHVRDPVILAGELEDEGVKDKRLLLTETELGRTLKVMGRESNTLSAVLRKAWDCDGKLSTLTKNSTNVATDPHISVIGHITCEELETLLKGTETANGFGNRFLWLCVRRSKDLPDGGSFFSIDWRPQIARLAELATIARGLDRMARDDEAREIWRAIYPELSGGQPGLMGSMLARGEAQVMRIACIYAMLDGLRLVGARHMMAALAIWKYAEASARFIFGESLGDAKAEKLLAALKAEPGGMKRTDISVKVFGRNLDSAKLGALLERLLSLGLIHRVVSQGTVGRKAELWFAGRSTRATK